MLSTLNRIAFAFTIIGVWSLTMVLTVQHVAFVYIWFGSWALAGVFFFAAVACALFSPNPS